MLLFLLVVLGSCGGSSSGEAPHDAKPSIIPMNNDAPVSSDDAGQADAPLTPTDAQVALDDGGINPYVPFDTGSVDLWLDPGTLFPDCHGTPDEISDCIINLPTRAGIPVTRPDPMPFSSCKP